MALCLRRGLVLRLATLRKYLSIDVDGDSSSSARSCPPRALQLAGLRSASRLGGAVDGIACARTSPFFSDRFAEQDAWKDFDAQRCGLSRSLVRWPNKPAYRPPAFTSPYGASLAAATRQLPLGQLAILEKHRVDIAALLSTARLCGCVKYNIVRSLGGTVRVHSHPE